MMLARTMLVLVVGTVAGAKEGLRDFLAGCKLDEESDYEPLLSIFASVGVREVGDLVDLDDADLADSLEAHPELSVVHKKRLRRKMDACAFSASLLSRPRARLMRINGESNSEARPCGMSPKRAF